MNVVPGWTGPKREAHNENIHTRRRPQHACYASQQEAATAVPAGNAFTIDASLRAVLKNYSAATTVGIWNSLTGVTPVRNFKDAAIP
jgi:hypothetical protein